jgi:S-DNA-T family DNA segregation ATPase FtsK/SpoIIIE
MEIAKQIGLKFLLKLKDQSKHSNLIIMFFFILGILLVLSMYFFKSDPTKTQEQSGLLGYYLYFVLSQLFGISAYFVGPLLVLFSVKSFINSNLKYLKNGLIGLILFLFSFSSLLSVLEYPIAGFTGEQLSIIGTYLLGKIGFVVFVILILIISIFYIFSLQFSELIDFFKNQKQKNFNLLSLLIGFIPIIMFFLQSKKWSLMNKKNQDVDANTENKEKQTSKKDHSMNFIKKLINNKIEIQNDLEKPPWIKKIEIVEEDSSEESNSQVESPRIIFTEESENGKDSISKIDKNIDSLLINSNIDEKNLEDGIIHQNIKIYYDPNKNRFIFGEQNEIKKKMIFNRLNKENLLDELELDPEIQNEIAFKQKDFHKKNDFILNEELPKEINNKLNIDNFEQTNENDSENKDIIIQQNSIDTLRNIEINLENSEEFKEEKETFLNQEEKENLEINEVIKNQEQVNLINTKEIEKSDGTMQKKEIYGLYSLNSEYIQKKLKELQEQIISSESSNKPYKLSLRNLKTELFSFQVSSASIQEEIQENWRKLEQVLNDYGIKGQVVGATRGPMITMYEIRLEPGVRVNRIMSLQDEIRMNLAALSVRIVAPIPGKTTIGIEIPNKNREYVNLGELVHKDSEFFSKKRDINIPLGKDVSGKTRYIDLTRLPHLLIAGATGSGKSVFLNSIIASLLYQYSPEQIRFLMIDPKMVELKLYEGIPHLLYPVIIDVKLAEKALHWAVNEMENRYKLFSLAKCRDIRSYNEKIKKGIINGNHIPYIVIIIDELSDLMMVSAKEVEESIIRLTQKARAVGIHMILATQRPSVDVITALIKANCPARISFQVAQKVDSRIILDLNGAETLLGKGDMLYRSPASTLPIRIQAPNITEEEIEIIVKETQNYDFLGYIDLPEESQSPTDFGFSQIDEDLIEKAWQIILETGKTSTSYIQRRLRIGYNRAANIMEKLEEMGYLSPAIGNKPREILKRI